MQAAVGAYYDFNSSQTVEKLPSMELLRDITVGEGESVPPSTRFVKTWRLKNNGRAESIILERFKFGFQYLSRYLSLPFRQSDVRDLPDQKVATVVEEVKS